MELYADRLAKLAGLPTSAKQNLNEASNRSYHDGDNSDEVEYRFGKGQLAEGEHADGKEEGHCMTEEEDSQEEGHCMTEEEDSQEEGMYREVDADDEANETSYTMEMKHDPDLVEIDESMLEEEISRMREERLQENELRSIIKKEIAAVVRSMQSSAQSRSDASTAQQGITKGWSGPGFQ